LESPALVSELGAYVRAGRPMPVAVEAFIQILRSELQGREEGVA
jgi:hypothetical protein